MFIFIPLLAARLKVENNLKLRCGFVKIISVEYTPGVRITRCVYYSFF